MTGKTVMITAIIAVAVVASAVMMITAFPDERTEPLCPNVPDGSDPVIPDPEPIYPVGISFDPETGTLSNEDEVTWFITDELVAFVDKNTETVVGKTLVLEKGL